MNKLTGSNKVTAKDEQNIMKLVRVGADDKLIAELTGWSAKTVQRVRTGRHEDVINAMREYSARKRESVLPPAAEIPEQTCIHIGSYDDAFTAVIGKLDAIEKLLSAALKRG